MKNLTATEYKKALKALTAGVLRFENAIDKAMRLPSTVERGKMIAKLTNELALANQTALHFTLGYSFEQIKKFYK